MQLIPWEGRQCGDIGFKKGDDPFGTAIENMTTDNPLDIAPSHCFVMGPQGVLFEAWLVCREGASSKYDEYAKRGRIELYRPEAGDKQKLTAYLQLVDRYNSKFYGIPQIAGHMLVLSKLCKNNPWPHGVVCHEIATYYLRLLWALDAKARGGVSPLEFSMRFNPDNGTPKELRDLCRGT